MSEDERFSAVGWKAGMEQAYANGLRLSRPVPYHPGLRITKGMRVRLPGGALFQILSVVDDDEGNPGVITLDLVPID